MKKIKVLALALALGIAGAVYAGNNSAQSAMESCDMSKADGSCCTSGASCCTGGSCCAMHKK
jgi:hypothetical protein